MNRKKVFIIAGIASALILGLVFLTDQIINQPPQNNSYYLENERTGTEDFVDPDQEKETVGKKSVSVRNIDSLRIKSTNDFSGDVANRISEYILSVYPEEKVVYMIEDSLVVENNKYSFVIENESDSKKTDIVAYLARQGYANVYFNGEGPFTETNPYLLLPESEIIEP